MLTKKRMLLAVTCLLLLTCALVAMSRTAAFFGGAAQPESEGGLTRQAERRPHASQLLTADGARQEYQRDLARLDDLSKTQDLNAVIKFADEAETRWGQRGGDYYARLMLNVSNVIANDFSDDRIYRLSQKYALAALSKSNSFSLDSEVSLLPFIAMDLAPKDAAANVEPEWAKERSLKARLWLHAWQRLEAERDKNFNFDDRPVMNVVPPRETGLPSGVAPEAIKDAKLRARYQAELTANAKKAEAYNRQYMLREMSKTFPRKAESYIVGAYSKPPYNFNELGKLMNQYVADHETRQRILREVTEKKIRD
jgi:hypothetical protein